MLTSQAMLSQTNHSHKHYTHYHRGNQSDVRPKTEGGFALMGGSTDQDEAFQWMAERGGQGDFLVLRGSGGDGYQDYIGELTQANSVDTIVLHDREAAQDPFVLDKVAKAEAIFFAGGDQWNYVGKWKDSPLLTELNKAIERKVPVGGTSAGLAILGEHVFSAEKNTITSAEALADPYHPAITLESDFLKAPPLRGLVTDSHFSERDRLGRLVTFMSRLQTDLDKSDMRGIGVDEKTALLVEFGGQARVVGQAGVHLVKAEGKPDLCQSDTGLTHSKLQLHSLVRGQSFHLVDWTSTEADSRPLLVKDGFIP